MAAFLFFPSTLLGAASRQDLQSTLKEYACENAPYSTLDLWKTGIFDTQIHLMKFKPRIKLAQQQIVSAILRKVRALNHSGYVHGICSDRSVWFASTPSAGGIRIESHQIQLPKDLFGRSCKKVKVSFSSARGGKSRTLFFNETNKIKSGLFLNTTLLPKGSLSVTCIPEHRKYGDQLWFLIPIQDHITAQFPFQEVIDSTKTKESILLWINEVRKDHYLSPLKSVVFKDVPFSTSKDHVNHEITEYESLKKNFSTKGYSLIGENRVIEADALSMAWMLWNSPTHRNLLLSTIADSIYLDLKELNTGQKSLTLLISKSD